MILDSIAVDAGCRGNPGIMEYRGVFVRTGQEIFRVGPYDDGTNNIGEFLAIVHGLALLKQKGSNLPIYSDSKVAQKWVRDGRCNTKITDTGRNSQLLQLVRRAEAWLAGNTYQNAILKWQTEKTGVRFPPISAENEPCQDSGFFFQRGLTARIISRFPPGGPGSRSTLNPTACKRRRIIPFAQ